MDLILGTTPSIHYLSARTTSVASATIYPSPAICHALAVPSASKSPPLFVYYLEYIRVLFVYPPFPSGHSGTSGIAVPASVLLCGVPDNARGVMGCTSRFRSRASPRLYTLHLTPYTKHKNCTILTISAFLFAQFKKMLYICGRNSIC